MCGLAGFLQRNGPSLDAASALAAAMARQIEHRGPDDAGTWVDPVQGIALGHRRLAILDLSQEGHQPMHSASGRRVLVFNGEIYNHRAIRDELERAGAAPAWRGHSDTEVMLAAIDAWGLDAALKRFVGMFAFALWDREACALFLARDRLGEKPLYYGWQGDTFLFGSELKALKAHPAFRAEVDRDALALLLRHNYIPAPYSIFKGIRKLLPGTHVRVSIDERQCDPTPYWSLREVAERGQAEPFGGSETEAVAQLHSRLTEAVGLQMVSDVPLGAFLSGGIDSSTVVALMQAQSSRPVKTFTIGFDEEGYNEAEHAKLVARHLGTDHTELYVTAEQARSVIPRLPVLYDEPFADASQIPTLLVSRLARQHVTVSLSGDAGDELFGGYSRYGWASSLWRVLGRMPAPLRKASAGGLGHLSPRLVDALYAQVSHLLPERFRVGRPSEKLGRLAVMLRASGPEDLYRALVSHCDAPARIVIDSAEPPTVLTDPAAWPGNQQFEDRMMYLDAMSYLPDDILVKVDRAAMGVSLETRVPFLDHRVVEFAAHVPLSMKMRQGEAKWLLRQVLYRYVPKELVDRPKMGFGVPIGTWLRGPLREWAEALLDEARLKREGFFNPQPIREQWREHLRGDRNWQYSLWNVLMFQAWLESSG
jgi:asparagine synthase (glutamine-hydrolysing)